MTPRMRGIVRRALARSRLSVNRLGERGALVQGGRRRDLVPHPAHGAHGPAWVVAAPETRAQAARHHLQVSDYLQGQHLAWLIEDLEIDCVLDVGANRGQFASRLRAGGYDGRIVSFEPVAHLVEELRAEAAGDPAWQVHAVALGETDETREINVDPRALSSMLPASDFGRSWKPRMAAPGTETIRVHRLDGLWDQVVDGLSSPRVLLKLDTQGFDLPAFRGAGERVAEIAAVQTEVPIIPIYDRMPSFTEHLETFSAAGFVLSAMFPVSFAFDSLRVIEFDALLVRPELTRDHRR